MDKRFCRPVGFLPVFAASPMIVTLLHRATPSSAIPGAGETRESSRLSGAHMVKKLVGLELAFVV
jgi:hypothetical protein